MKKIYLCLTMMALSSALFTSCISDDDSDKGKSTTKIVVTSGLYVVNNGTLGQKNGSMTYFDYATLKEQQLLSGASGLGDTPNDAYSKGDTIFVVGSAENTIFVVNKTDFSIIKRISTTEAMGEAEGNNPRHITGYGNSIYFTTHGGYVGILDAKTLAMSQFKYKVGSAPEGLSIGGTSSEPVLYVANSDNGNGNASISKINLSNGTVDEIKNEKIQNPQEIVALGDELYILDGGHYTEDHTQQLDAGLYYYYNNYTKQLIADATGLGVGMVYVNDQVVGYLLVTFNDPLGSTSKPTYSTYNTYTGLTGKLSLSGDKGIEIFSPAAIAVDPIRGHIASASRPKDPESPEENPWPSYTQSGYVNMYSSSGEYIKDTHFQTGVEPHMIGFAFNSKTITY